MKHLRTTPTWVLLSVMLLGATSPALAESSKQDALPLSTEEWRLYRELAGRIKASYVDPVDDKKLFNACLGGMARGLDPHSAYLDATAFKNLLVSSEDSAGVGLSLGMKNNRAQVIALLEDSPAFQAGIRRGDLIAKIDGTTVIGLSLDEVVQRLRGKSGTPVRLTLQREGATAPVTYNLTRAVITQKTVKQQLLEAGYGHIQISAFHANTIEAFAEGIRSLYQQNQRDLKGLVLDLRDNPGGLFDSALALSAVFLPRNTPLLHTEGQGEDSTRKYLASDEDIGRLNARKLNSLPNQLKQLPLVVLVNGGSAAGVEIVAGALQDHQRAVIVGTPTFGKDSLQTIQPLSDQSAVKLTVSRWRTPQGRSPFPDGIIPDILVEATEGTLSPQDGKLLERALSILKDKAAALDKQSASAVPPTSATPPHAETDPSGIDTLRKAALTATSGKHQGQAIDLWNQLLARQPDDPQALRLRGSLHAEQGKHDLARADHLRVAALAPNSPITWHSLCWSKLLAGEFSAAQVDCEKSIALDPGDLAGTVNLGHTHLLRGERIAAWGWYEKALPLIETKQELETSLLADFEIFKQRGWQPELAQAGHDWFVLKGGEWLVRKAPADKLLSEAKAAEAAKDRQLEVRLRVERLTELEKLLVPDHPIVIRAADALADTYAQAKRPDLALPLYRRVVAYRQSLAGSPPAGLTMALSDVIRTLPHIKQPEEIISALEQLLAVMEKVWGKEHQTTITFTEKLADLYTRTGRIDQALSNYQHVLAYRRDRGDHATNLITLHAVARMLTNHDRPAEATPYLEEALQIAEKVFGAESATAQSNARALAAHRKTLKETLNKP